MDSGLRVPLKVINFDTPNREKILDNGITEDECILGRGAYGVVFKAVYKKRDVAVKVLEKRELEKFQSLKKEAHILHLNHPNIIKILKIVDAENHGAVIMELFDGKNLQQTLDGCKIDLLHRLFILTDIADALAFCHQKGIIHADIKPQNILVAIVSHGKRKYLCKLFDFGCSISLDDDGYSGNVGGTVRYCAPEILQGHEPSCFADIFSFAIIMWQLKENRIPYGNISKSEIIIWNVVKHNLRPDSLMNNLADDSNFIKNLCQKKSVHISKSEFSFRLFKKIINMPHTPTSYIRNKEKVPGILVTRQENELPLKTYGSNQKNRVNNSQKKVRTRKKLFYTKSLKLSPKYEEDYENDDPLNMICDLQSLLIDRNPRSHAQTLFVASEYEKLYTCCWHHDPCKRPIASDIIIMLQKLINLL